MDSEGGHSSAASHGDAHPARSDGDDVRAQTAQSAAILESLHEGVVVYDFELETVLSMNASARRILGVADDADWTLTDLRQIALVSEEGEPIGLDSRRDA